MSLEETRERVSSQRGSGVRDRLGRGGERGGLGNRSRSGRLRGCSLRLLAFRGLRSTLGNIAFGRWNRWGQGIGRVAC